jgi:hypothetical protein
MVSAEMPLIKLSENTALLCATRHRMAGSVFRARRMFLHAETVVARMSAGKVRCKSFGPRPKGVETVWMQVKHVFLPASFPLQERMGPARASVVGQAQGWQTSTLLFTDSVRVLPGSAEMNVGRGAFPGKDEREDKLHLGYERPG